MGCGRHLSPYVIIIIIVLAMFPILSLIINVCISLRKISEAIQFTIFIHFLSFPLHNSSILLYVNLSKFQKYFVLFSLFFYLYLFYTFLFYTLSSPPLVSFFFLFMSCGRSIHSVFSLFFLSLFISLRPVMTRPDQISSYFVLVSLPAVFSVFVQMFYFKSFFLKDSF